MANNNRTCFTCGKKHSYCPTCYDDREKESWHIMFDTENCKGIYEIINKHFYNHITTEEAFELLKLCDLTNKDDFIDDIKNDLANIYALYDESKKISTKQTRKENI
jgi:hypothetical protein